MAEQVSDAADDPPPDQAMDLEDVHKEAMRRHDEAWIFERDNIQAGREDQLFYHGGLGQWTPEAIKARGTSRPMLTVNRLPTFVRQLTGDIRQNTPAMKVLPSKGPASQDIAEIENGIIRSIEAQSDAAACYVIAAENAAKSGQGAFRIVTQYSDDTGFEQDIRIRPIRDPFGVMIDPLAQLPDKSDMEFAYIYERYSKVAFKAKFPGKTADDVPNNAAAASTGTGFNWNTGDTVRVAEYWRRRATKKKIYQLEDGSVVDKLEDGVEAKNEREVESYVVESFLISGVEVLSGPHPWAGKYIPICMVVGEEDTIDGATKRKGMVRDAKDPQRLYNYARTAAAESIALQPKAPFIVTVDQIKGYEDIWDTAGSENHPYLVINDAKGGGQQTYPQRAQPAMGQQGLDSQALVSANDLEAVTGIFKANLGAPSNETSGRAILSRQKEGDTGTFLYVDNLRRAISYCGRCLLDLIPKVYDSERIVRVLKEDGTHEMATVNQQVQDEQNPGVWKVLNDLSLGEYDIVVSTGPSFLTRRAESASMMIDLAGKMPVVNQIAPDLLVRALDIPGGDEIAARLERSLPPHIVSDEPLPPPPTPPDLVAKVEKDQAQGALYRAQAEALGITNIETGVGILQTIHEMHMMLPQLKAALDAFAAPPGAPQPDVAAPQPALPGAIVKPPGSEGGAPPAPIAPPTAGGMGELEPMPAGAP